MLLVANIINGLPLGCTKLSWKAFLVIPAPVRTIKRVLAQVPVLDLFNNRSPRPSSEVRLVNAVLFRIPRHCKVQ
jgi:hypothetical protein